jgi:hypothetical protein
MNNILRIIPLFIFILFLLLISCTKEDPIGPQEKPVAIAGADQLVNVWESVHLQGSLGKTPAEVEFLWTLALKPQGSNAALFDSLISNPSFKPDKIGDYVLKLTVKRDGQISEPDSVKITAVFQESTNYFPNSVGSKWIYSVMDSIRSLMDTVMVEIVGSKILPGNIPVTVWHFSCAYGSGACLDDTLYVRTNGDSVITFLYNHQFYGTDGRASYIFPLVVGYGWEINYDSSLVLEENPTSINAGEFSTAFKIHRSNSRPPNYLLLADSWFVQNVGLVKMDLVEWDTWWFRHRIEHWELIWYHLNE